MKPPRILPWLSLSVVGMVTVMGLGLPLLAVLVRTPGLGASLLDPGVLGVARATVFQAVLSTVISAAIGVGLGLWIFGDRAAERWLAVPFAVPTVVAAPAWIAWLGRRGLLAKLGLHWDLAYSLSAVILAHVFLNAPWITLLIARARSDLPEQTVHAARTLGASRWSVFRFVEWPAIRWALASGCAQTLSLCAMSFALILILGGGPPVQTLETALYGRIRSGNLDIPGAAACAVWEVALTLLPWVLLLFLQGRGESQAGGNEAGSPTRVGSRGTKFPLKCLVASAFTLPYFIIFSPRSMLKLFAASQGAALARAVGLSSGIAFASALGALLVSISGVIAARSFPRFRAIVLTALSLPSGFSVLVLGLGVWLAYSNWIDPFEGSLPALITLQVLVFTPLCLRILWPVALKTRVTLLEAARTLGATPTRAFFQVEWPRWRAPILSAAAISAGASLGEVAAVSFFYSERLVTLPLLISQWMGRYQFQAAEGGAALLLLLSVATVWAVQVWGTGHES